MSTARYSESPPTFIVPDDDSYPSERHVGPVSVTHGRERRAQHALIALEDHAEPDAIAVMRRGVEEAVAAGYALVVIDLRAVETIYTTALVQLCVALRRVGEIGPTIAVVAVAGRAAWVIDCCQIAGLEMHSTLRSATGQRRLLWEMRTPRSGNGRWSRRPT